MPVPTVISQLTWAAGSSLMVASVASLLEAAGIPLELILGMSAWCAFGLIGGGARLAYAGYHGEIASVRRALFGLLAGGFVGMVTGSLCSYLVSIPPPMRIAIVSMSGFSADALILAWDTAMEKAKLGSALGVAFRAGLKAFMRGTK